MKQSISSRIPLRFENTVSNKKNNMHKHAKILTYEVFNLLPHE